MIHEHNYDKDEYQAKKWQHKHEYACIETFPEDVSQIVLVCYFKVPWKMFFFRGQFRTKSPILQLKSHLIPLNAKSQNTFL